MLHRATLKKSNFLRSKLGNTHLLVATIHYDKQIACNQTLATNFAVYSQTRCSRKATWEATYKFWLQLGQSNQVINTVRLIAIMQYSEQNIQFDCTVICVLHFSCSRSLVPQQVQYCKNLHGRFQVQDRNSEKFPARKTFAVCNCMSSWHVIVRYVKLTDSKNSFITWNEIIDIFVNSLGRCPQVASCRFASIKWRNC